MFRMFILVVGLGALLLTPAFAWAQAAAAGQGEAPDIKYRKKTVYDFDDDLVEGELQRPDGEFIDTRRTAKHSSLIKIRKDFIPEMLKSAEDI